MASTPRTWGGLIAGLCTAAALASGHAAASPCPAANQRRDWAPPAVPDPAAPPRITASAGTADYRDRLRPTPAGWPRLQRWCVWVQPSISEGPGAIWEQRWQQAVQAALAEWQRHLPIERVFDKEQAQVRVYRRRPPALLEAGGRRASHGRALITPQHVEREGLWRLEPTVDVLLSPEQRAAALQATALHELGHAFGLWGHSNDPRDAMAAIPGSTPVLQLSERDLATLRWLYEQPTPFGQPQPLPR